MNMIEIKRAHIYLFLDAGEWHRPFLNYQRLLNFSSNRKPLRDTTACLYDKEIARSDPSQDKILITLYILVAVTLSEFNSKKSFLHSSYQENLQSVLCMSQTGQENKNLLFQSSNKLRIFLK